MYAALTIVLAEGEALFFDCVTVSPGWCPHELFLYLRSYLSDFYY